MKIRFQADADFNQAIVLGKIRREPNIDFQTAVAAGLEGLTDQEVLVLAAKEGRILVTHDQVPRRVQAPFFRYGGKRQGILIPLNKS